MVSQKEIANRVGVSQRAVSFALAGRPGVRDSLRARILEVAAELGYRPNAAAQAMSSGRFGAVGMIIPSNAVMGRSMHLPPELASHLVDGLAGAMRSHLVIAEYLLPDPGAELIAPAVMRSRAVDGLIVVNFDRMPESVQGQIRSVGLPMVHFNSPISVASVRPDDFGAGRTAAQMFIERGHRRAAYVRFGPTETGLPTHYSVLARSEGFASGFASSGRPAPAVFSGAVPYAERISAARELLRSPERPTAVFCYDSDEAVVMRVAAASLGLVLPRDLSLITVGDPGQTLASLSVDRLVIRYSIIAREIVGMLRLIVGAPVAQTEPMESGETRVNALRSKDVPMAYYPGATLGPVPS